jgi:hypothetical protein
MNCFVFVHVPRTAGSSVWHHLAYQGADEDFGVFDIYHESIQRYGDPSYTHWFLGDVLRELDMPSCLFHHHSPDGVFDEFAEYDSVFATLLRDPVDRFVSDVFHFRRFIRTTAAGGRMRARIREAWTEDFMASLTDENVPVRQLLDSAAREPCFRNFYVQFFASLCWNVPKRDSANVPLPVYSDQEIRNLAKEIRRRFQVIGWFGNLQSSLSEIQRAFSLPSDSAPLTNTINTGHDKPQLSPREWRRYASAFEADYQLLDELRSLTLSQKSTRQRLRLCRRFVPISSRWLDETLPLDLPGCEQPSRERELVTEDRTPVLV